MICLIALVVFGILAVFSARYRAYFKEAADCVFRRMTLRKCTTSFDKKMKVKISSKISNRSRPLGGYVFKHFEALSWLMTIVMIVSLVWSGYWGTVGLYNWVVYQNCNGPESDEACVFNSITGQMTPAPGATSTFDPSKPLEDCNGLLDPAKIGSGTGGEPAE